MSTVKKLATTLSILDEEIRALKEIPAAEIDENTAALLNSLEAVRKHFAETLADWED